MIDWTKLDKDMAKGGYDDPKDGRMYNLYDKIMHNKNAAGLDDWLVSSIVSAIDQSGAIDAFSVSKKYKR